MLNGPISNVKSADPVDPLPLGSHWCVLRICSPIGRYARAYLLVAAAVAVRVALVLWIGGVNANLAGV